METHTSSVTGSPAATGPAVFRFCTSLILPEATGLRASTLPTLAKLLRTVPASSIYHHTHYFLLQHHYLRPEPTNDFAYWVTEVLGDARLGEQLASIDTMAYASLEALREVLARTIEAYLDEYPQARLRFVAEDEDFFFLKAVHVVVPTPYAATTLLEFAQALERVSPNALYFHMFGARLRLSQPTNDFAKWLGEQLGLKELAAQVADLDPYAYTLDTLRARLLALLRQHLGLL